MRCAPLLVIVAAAAAACARATPARAQARDLTPGARIRAQLSPATGRVDGTIISREVDSLVIATLRGTQYRASLGALRSVDVYHGRSRMIGAKKGAVWGAVIAAVPLAIAYAAADPKRDRWSRGDQLRFSLVALKIYTETGAVIGAFVRADDWRRCAAATAPTCESRP